MYILKSHSVFSVLLIEVEGNEKWENILRTSIFGAIAIFLK